jgi:hypothetical protein
LHVAGSVGTTIMQDFDGVHEELLRRSSERERQIWSELIIKHILHGAESAKGLAFRLRRVQAVESINPKLWRDDIPEGLRSVYQDVGEHLKGRIIRAAFDNDTGFLKRLYEASLLVDKGESPFERGLSITGYALAAWRHLCDELGHRPSLNQLRECTEELRKKDGLGSRFSDKQWSVTLEALEPLLRHGQ